MSGLRLDKHVAAAEHLHAPHNQKELRVRFASRIIACLVGSSVLGFAPHGLLHAQDPYPDVTRGKAIYERHCQACHGLAGYGDGPEAAALKVPPANFHRSAFFFKSDDALLQTIEYGVVLSPMHSWQGRLSEGEMQDVVAYIRLFFQQGR